MITVEEMQGIRKRYNKGAQPTPRELQYLALKSIRYLYGRAHGEVRVLRSVTVAISHLIGAGYTQASSEAIVADWLGLINVGNAYTQIIASLRGGE